MGLSDSLKEVAPTAQAGLAAIAADNRWSEQLLVHLATVVNASPESRAELWAGAKQDDGGMGVTSGVHGHSAFTPVVSTRTPEELLEFTKAHITTAADDAAWKKAFDGTFGLDWETLLIGVASLLLMMSCFLLQFLKCLCDERPANQAAWTTKNAKAERQKVRRSAAHKDVRGRWKRGAHVSARASVFERLCACAQTLRELVVIRMNDDGNSPGDPSKPIDAVGQAERRHQFAEMKRLRDERANTEFARSSSKMEERIEELREQELIAEQQQDMIRQSLDNPVDGTPDSLTPPERAP